MAKLEIQGLAVRESAVSPSNAAAPAQAASLREAAQLQIHNYLATTPVSWGGIQNRNVPPQPAINGDVTVATTETATSSPPREERSEGTKKATYNTITGGLAISQPSIRQILDMTEALTEKINPIMLSSELDRYVGYDALSALGEELYKWKPGTPSTSSVVEGLDVISKTRDFGVEQKSAYESSREPPSSETTSSGTDSSPTYATTPGTAQGVPPAQSPSNPYPGPSITTPSLSSEALASLANLNLTDAGAIKVLPLNNESISLSVNNSANPNYRYSLTLRRDQNTSNLNHTLYVSESGLLFDVQATNNRLTGQEVEIISPSLVPTRNIVDAILEDPTPFSRQR